MNWLNNVVSRFTSSTPSSSYQLVPTQDQPLSVGGDGGAGAGAGVGRDRRGGKRRQGVKVMPWHLHWQLTMMKNGKKTDDDDDDTTSVFVDIVTEDSALWEQRCIDLKRKWIMKISENELHVLVPAKSVLLDLPLLDTSHEWEEREEQQEQQQKEHDGENDDGKERDSGDKKELCYLPGHALIEIDHDPLHVEMAKNILEVDRDLAKLRYRLVPRVVSERLFWTNYFERVYCITDHLQRGCRQIFGGNDNDENGSDWIGIDDSDVDDEDKARNASSTIYSSPSEEAIAERVNQMEQQLQKTLDRLNLRMMPPSASGAMGGRFLRLQQKQRDVELEDMDVQRFLYELPDVEDTAHLLSSALDKVIPILQNGAKTNVDESNVQLIEELCASAVTHKKKLAAWISDLAMSVESPGVMDRALGTNSTLQIALSKYSTFKLLQRRHEKQTAEKSLSTGPQRYDEHPADPLSTSNEIDSDHTAEVTDFISDLSLDMDADERAWRQELRRELGIEDDEDDVLLRREQPLT